MSNISVEEATKFFKEKYGENGVREVEVTSDGQYFLCTLTTGLTFRFTAKEIANK